MKKKIFTTVTAVAMTFAMATSAMAATPRGTGNVDGSTAENNTVVVNSNDASIINDAKKTETYVDEGEFDGDWKDTGFKMTGNGQRVMDYVLTPEKLSESLSLRAYVENSATDGGFGAKYVAKLYDGLEVDSEKTEWNGVYTDTSAPLKAESNYTLDKVLTDAAELVDGSSESQDEFGSYLSGIAFEGFGKNAGKEVYLTSDEGWGVFAVAMRDIVPLSAEDFEASGYAGNSDEVFDGDYGIVGTEPYTDINTLSTELQARANAFKAMKNIVVTNTTHAEGVNDTNIGKSATVSELYSHFKEAFPSDSSDEAKEAFKSTCDHFGEIYTRRYNVGVVDKDGSETLSSNTNHENNSNFVQKLVDAKAYDYENATLQDIRDYFGDKIKLSTTKDGEKTWGFVLELYVAYNK